MNKGARPTCAELSLGNIRILRRTQTTLNLDLGVLALRTKQFPVHEHMIPKTHGGEEEEDKGVSFLYR